MLVRNSGFDYSIDLSINCLFVKHYGVFGLEATVARAEAIAADESYRPGLNRVIDGTGCIFDMDATELRKISDHIALDEYNRGVYREANLVDNPLAHGLVRILHSTASSPFVEFQIFDTRSETVNQDLRRWLEIDADHDLPNFIDLYQDDAQREVGVADDLRYADDFIENIFYPSAFG